MVTERPWPLQTAEPLLIPSLGGPPNARRHSRCCDTAKPLKKKSDSKLVGQLQGAEPPLHLLSTARLLLDGVPELPSAKRHRNSSALD